MKTPQTILSPKHPRYQQFSVPNLEHSGRPIQRLQDTKVHDVAMLGQMMEGLQ
jgi:hypothetical protein